MHQNSAFARALRTCSISTLVLAISTGSLWAGGPSSGEAPAQDLIPLSLTSGPVENTTAQPAVVYSTVVEQPDAAWIRVVFGDVILAGNGDAASYLRLTSVLDGGVQTLNASTLEQWQHHSAFFNGGAVLVELIAQPGVGANLVEISGILAGFAEEDDGGATPRSFCDGDDNRQLSFDPRSGRAVNAAGTQVGAVFLINDANRQFLTSGQTGGLLTGAAVIEFNAPLTFPNGTTLNHPPPEDQYAYDAVSIQRVSGGAGSGNNWCYFGCFANSTTGQTPFQRQQAFFELADEIPEAQGQDIRIYSYGATVPPVFRTWSFVQKTMLGEYQSFVGTEIKFRADATMGDSGAPIVDDGSPTASGDVIGIAYADGCTEFGGANGATAVNNPGLRNALANPLGVCRSLIFSIAGGPPELIDNGGATLMVDITGINGNTPDPASGLLHFNTGQGWSDAPLTHIGGATFQASFPPFACGTMVKYFFSAVTQTTGVRVPDPKFPPLTNSAIAANSYTVIASIDFESATGWTVDGTVTAGAWQHGTPAGNGTNGGPASDFDGSGQCWQTGNTAGEDVDGGPTRLRSPNFNCAGTSNAFVRFARWFTNDDLDDSLIVQISNNGGLSFVTAETIGDAPGWNESRFRIDQFIPPTSGMRFRFVVSDNPNNSQTEAALDAFSIIEYECSAAACTKGDVNGDGAVDGRDIGLFAQNLLTGGTPGSLEFCAVDFNNNQVLDVDADAAAFVECLINGTCP